MSTMTNQKLQHLFFMVILFTGAGFLAACTETNEAASASQPQVVTIGAERLLSDYRPLAEGKRAGIITNHSAVVGDRHLIDLVHEDPGITITALFGPEHGLRGQADAGEAVGHSRDEQTGAPVYSLYGEHNRPTMEMLEDVDVLIFDMQDVGARFYTYAATMGRSMRSAAEAGIPFLVLDRPNPLGGNRIEGFIRDDEFVSGIGLYPTPVTHGMTIGELALMIKGEGWMEGLENLDLHVIEMEGWTRDMLWDETGLEWIPPSPNIPDVETAWVYPGTCFFEGTTASEGRGTYEPFLQVGSPYADAGRMAGRLNERRPEGLRFSPVTFTPESIDGMSKNPKLLGEEIAGVRLEVTDAKALRPVAAGIHLLEVFYNGLPDEHKAAFFNDRGMAIRAGNEKVLEMIENGEGAQAIIDLWQEDVEAFSRQREPYLIYR